MNWLVIHNWPQFQHYKDRDPVFIKDYVAENHDADYRALNGFLRGVLHGLRREYAASNGRLPWDPYELSRRLSLKVHARHLQELKTAGKIEEVASRPLALARSREEEKEKELETPKPPSRRKGVSDKEKIRRKACAWIDHNRGQLDDVDLAYVISDQFEISDPELVSDLVAYASERIP